MSHRRINLSPGPAGRYHPNWLLEEKALAMVSRTDHLWDGRSVTFQLRWNGSEWESQLINRLEPLIGRGATGREAVARMFELVANELRATPLEGEGWEP